MAERGDIDRVREASDIVELVSEVTKVKKSGRSYMAVCPFHQEKTPSMSLDRARGLYHCFGCDAGGDVFKFVQETQGVEFGEALDLLAAKAGIQLVRDPAAAKRRADRAKAVEALRRAVDVYHDRLKQSSDAGPARAYLRARGYNVELIDEWKLGFAGTDWDTLSRTLRTGGVSDDAMIHAGLARKGSRSVYDFFRGRLMFPIFDHKGDPVGFGGRRVDEIDNSIVNNPNAKYVNSPDSDLYQKSKVLFGFDRARAALDEEHPAVVVEGYTDVIAMHDAGVTTAVATCGTAFGEGHYDLLRRFTQQVVLAFDPDEAGSRAALRTDDLETPWRLGFDVRVAALDLDPGDLHQRGRFQDMVEAVKEARPLVEYRLEDEVSRYPTDTPEGRFRALKASVTLLGRITNERIREQYFGFLARTIGNLEQEDVRAAMRGVNVRSRIVPDASRPPNRLELELLRVVLTNPRGMEISASDFSDERVRAAFLAIEAQLTGVQPETPVDPMKVEDPELQSIILGLAMDDRPLPEWDEMKQRVRMRRIDAEVDDLEEKLAASEEGTQTHSDYLRQLIALQQEKRSSGQ